jgi:Fe-S-cluster containining protein
MGNLTVDAADVRRWHKERRADILHYVAPVGAGYDVWIEPDTGRERTRCPFVRKDRGASTYKCRIHHTRPQVCRDYLADYEQMVNNGCEIIDELRKLGIDATSWTRYRDG